jgi:two-component system NtrC family sensor kinase
MKILIAEDEAVARKLLERYLQQWGYETTLAQDGEEAWTLFQQGDYPIVITDWMMPRSDGLELIRRIRQSELADCVYTILLSARSQKEDLVEGMEAGADDFVSKPFDRDELRVRLREAERIVRLERELAAQNKRLEDGRDSAAGRAAASEATPTGIVQAIHAPLDELAENLTAARRELSAFRNAVNSYRDACQRLSGSQPDVRAELTQLDGQFDSLNLDGLLDRMVASLEQVGDILKNLQQQPSSAET